MFTRLAYCRSAGFHRALRISALTVTFLLQSNPVFSGPVLLHGLSSGQIVDAVGRLEVAFSPNEGSEALVIRVIDSARKELRVMAYSFTSAPVTQALIAASKRGVDIKVVVDEKNNLSQDAPKARAALSGLLSAGIDVRTINAYPIHHDKVIVVDRKTVQLGSFNYSAAAANRNSENVLVNWENPQLAQVYLRHFTRNYAQSVAYRIRY
ncbi:phospholipase D family nuclease [Limnohabitans radicicola]|uniref:phospholipase D n=1 Tax=Limnohabitans radicicola TaxID=2771427 RepID=A0A927FI23_9BURK|nr:phospholipase D family protein [Limnohabitans radicicola]MBD8051101.1 phospholipase D family protein [Limnohabitans radicicola]